jgi:hypothetical protein
MVSVADIPFCFLKFMGCIAIVFYKEKEYRFASYLGARIITMSKDFIILS